jgi:hypothetical protein
MKTLPNASSKYGAQMGRRSFNDASDAPVKCSLRKLRWVDGDYDEQGAYWGHTPGTHIYWCNFDIGDTNEDIFVRATSRAEAKAEIREQLPNARFYR